VTNQVADLNLVHQVFVNHDLPWALFGGAVVALYEQYRRIRDIDIITIDSALDDVANDLNIKVSLDPYNQSFVQVGRIEIYGSLHILTSVGLHLFALDAEMISRREYMRLASIKVPILSREDHIVLKAILQRGSEMDKSDVQDILALSCVGPLDIHYIQHRIELSGALGRADQLLRSLGIL
jgi:hypothetical protein